MFGADTARALVNAGCGLTLDQIIRAGVPPDEVIAADRLTDEDRLISAFLRHCASLLGKKRPSADEIRAFYRDAAKTFMEIGTRSAGELDSDRRVPVRDDKA